MANSSVVVQGTITQDGGLKLDQKVPLPPGPVQITIQPAHEPSEKQASWWQHLQKARAILESRGTGFRTQEDIDAERAAFRAEN